jgi:CheY-like chemotaxis protein
MLLKQMNILLADDDTDDCMFFKEALEELFLPTDLTAVHDGEQLMQLLTSETTKLPHVLFLDLNMPRKNGFECLSEIKLNAKLNGIPVIIFSTSFEHETVNQLHKSGAHYYIRKPSQFSQFKSLIQQSLEFIAQALTDQPNRDNFVLKAQSN